MRAFYVLLVAVVSLIATSDAAEASTTAHLAAINEPQEASGAKRLLRNHQAAEEDNGDSVDSEDDDDSEERGYFTKGTLDDVLSKLTADKLKSQSFKESISAWLNNAKVLDYTDDAIFQIKASKHLSESFKTRMISWLNGGKKNDVELVPREMLVRASAGNIEAQNTLFARWDAASKTIKKAVVESVFQNGQNPKLKIAWESYLAKKATTLVYLLRLDEVDHGCFPSPTWTLA